MFVSEELSELHKYYMSFYRAYVVMLNDPKYFALKDWCFMQALGHHYSTLISKTKEYPFVREFFKKVWIGGIECFA